MPPNVFINVPVPRELHRTERAASRPPRTPFRVMQVVTRLGAGSPPLHVLRLNQGMGRYGFEMLLVTGTCATGEQQMSYLVDSTTRIVYIPELQRALCLRSDLLALWRLYRIMRVFKPDIVHTHTAKAGALGRIAGRLAGVPVCVHTFHGHVFCGYFNRFGSFAVRLFERFLALMSDAIIVISEQQADDICDRFRVAPRCKVRVVPLGLWLDPFLELPFPGVQTLSVGWLGRFVPIKGVPLLAEIVKQTLDQGARIRFVIAGDGPERSVIESLVVRFGRARVEWLGWCEEVAPVLERCDILIQTSINEGTPVSLIQGMAARRPFVSTPVGGVVDLAVGPGQACGEAVWHDNCVLVPPDPKAFVNVFSRFATDKSLRARMGIAAQVMVLQNHSEEDMFARIASAYSDLLAAKHKGHRNVDGSER